MTLNLMIHFINLSHIVYSPIQVQNKVNWRKSKIKLEWLWIFVTHHTSPSNEINKLTINKCKINLNLNLNFITTRVYYITFKITISAHGCNKLYTVHSNPPHKIRAKLYTNIHKFPLKFTTHSTSPIPNYAHTSFLNKFNKECPLQFTQNQEIFFHSPYVSSLNLTFPSPFLHTDCNKLSKYLHHFTHLKSSHTYIINLIWTYLN